MLQTPISLVRVSETGDVFGIPARCECKRSRGCNCQPEQLAAVGRGQSSGTWSTRQENRVPECSTVFYSISVTFSRRQNVSDGEQIRGCQGWERGGVRPRVNRRGKCWRVTGCLCTQHAPARWWPCDSTCVETHGAVHCDHLEIK